MMYVDPKRVLRRRRGNVILLMGLLLPVFMAIMALSIDVGAVALARAQLQTVSDAAALAGAQQLLETQRLQMGAVDGVDISSAQTSAVAFAAGNRVLGDGAVLLPNASNSNSGTEDIVIGYLARPLDSSQSLQTNSAVIPYYNAVQIRASRSASHGGRVPAFFSALWNNAGSEVATTSTAAALGISGFKSMGSSTNANCLPIVLEKETYAAMIRGQTTDQYTYNQGTNSVTTGGDGITESRLYPVGNGYPGNWGTIKVGVSNNSTSILGAQIRYGITPAQLATYPDGILQPDPVTGTIDFEGNPGISAGLKDDLTSIIGKPVRIPIYDATQSSGNGNNLVYTVVAFAPVRILKVVFTGKNKYVIIQPAPPPADPTQVWGGIRNGPLPEQFRLTLIR